MLIYSTSIKCAAEHTGAVRTGVCVDGAKTWSYEVMTRVVYGGDVAARVFLLDITLM